MFWRSWRTAELRCCRMGIADAARRSGTGRAVRVGGVQGRPMAGTGVHVPHPERRLAEQSHGSATESGGDEAGRTNDLFLVRSGNGIG